MIINEGLNVILRRGIAAICLFHVTCVCLRIVVSNTYCGVFLFIFVVCTLSSHVLWIIHCKSKDRKYNDHKKNVKKANNGGQSTCIES